MKFQKTITFIVEHVEFYAGEGEYCYYYYVDVMILISGEYPLITTMEMRYSDTLLYAKQT